MHVLQYSSAGVRVQVDCFQGGCAYDLRQLNMHRANHCLCCLSDDHLKGQASWLSREQSHCLATPSCPLYSGRLVLPSAHLLDLFTENMHATPAAGDSTNQFSGVLDCFSKTFRREGLLAFYNGFGPNFARLGSWNVVMFLTVEQVKKLFQPKD